MYQQDVEREELREQTFSLKDFLAGLRLRERWADWSRAEFTAESPSHVSVCELPA